MAEGLVPTDEIKFGVGRLMVKVEDEREQNDVTTMTERNESNNNRKPIESPFSVSALLRPDKPRRPPAYPPPLLAPAAAFLPALYPAPKDQDGRNFLTGSIYLSAAVQAAAAFVTSSAPSGLHFDYYQFFG